MSGVCAGDVCAGAAKKGDQDRPSAAHDVGKARGLIKALIKVLIIAGHNDI